MAGEGKPAESKSDAKDWQGQSAAVEVREHGGKGGDALYGLRW